MEFNPDIADKVNLSKTASDYKTNLTASSPVIDIAFASKLLSDVFGVESPVYLPNWWQKRDRVFNPYSDVKLRTKEEDEEDAPVRFGQKTFGSFRLKGGKYLYLNQFTGEVEKRVLNDFLMPLATLVDFERDKRTTITPTNGPWGSVKELSGLDDWQITIRGIILPDNERTDGYSSVRKQMNMIQEFCECASSVEVDGVIFSDRKISRIYLKKPRFSPVEGKPHMTTYTIEALSDYDILLTDL